LKERKSCFFEALIRVDLNLARYVFDKRLMHAFGRRAKRVSLKRSGANLTWCCRRQLTQKFFFSKKNLFPCS
jgi:hypothetical protein